MLILFKAFAAYYNKSALDKHNLHLYEYLQSSSSLPEHHPTPFSISVHLLYLLLTLSLRHCYHLHDVVLLCSSHIPLRCFSMPAHIFYLRHVLKLQHIGMTSGYKNQNLFIINIWEITKYKIKTLKTEEAVELAAWTFQTSKRYGRGGNALIQTKHVCVWHFNFREEKYL